MSLHLTAVEGEPPVRFPWLARAMRDPEYAAELNAAMDDVLLAGHGQMYWLKLKPDHPPLDESMGVGLAAYGGAPGASYDLWLMCRAVKRQRDTIDRAGGTEVLPSVALPEPDEAPGLSVESVGEEVDQPRLSNGMGEG